jgi:hypothetical protein
MSRLCGPGVSNALQGWCRVRRFGRLKLELHTRFELGPLINLGTNLRVRVGFRLSIVNEVLISLRDDILKTLRRLNMLPKRHGRSSINNEGYSAMRNNCHLGRPVQSTLTAERGSGGYQHIQTVAFSIYRTVQTCSRTDRAHQPQDAPFVCLANFPKTRFRNCLRPGRPRRSDQAHSAARSIRD